MDFFVNVRLIANIFFFLNKFLIDLLLFSNIADNLVSIYDDTFFLKFMPKNSHQLGIILGLDLWIFICLSINPYPL